MPKAQLNLLALRSADADRAAQFYAALGLEFTRHRHGTGPEHYACEQESMVFELYPRQQEGGETKATRIGFCVPSVDTALAALEDLGGRVVSQAKDSPWGRRAVIDDPDGHRVELTEAPTSTDEA